MRVYSRLKKIYRNFRNSLSALTINFSLFSIYKTHLTAGSDKNVISFCLFGNDDKYFSNINACIESYQRIFQGWTIRLYVGSDVSREIIASIKNYGCELIIMKNSGIDYRYTFWRFLVLDDAQVSRALIRDIDSVASAREMLMVDQWIASGKKMHVIRDHPGHVDLVMAGMWGIYTCGISQQVRQKMLGFKKLNKFGVDQEFLSTLYYHYYPDIFVNDICKRFPSEEPVILPHDERFFYVGEINSEYPHKERHKNELKDFYASKQICAGDNK